ncbi:translation initiation factor IF-3 [Candidatus Odyssella thessalonicensis]|uniref:translation initiation factor IF-3 n=1 Tax=Candidatus Odyssella thessalonicensis TaxID=84647 RepID=UPI00049837CB|nr:translation initiation factor IF-3 [Candidatus Odyssella thessalonicensis]
MARFNNNAPSPKDGPRVNQEITSKEVRLVGADGEMVGVVSRSEALRLAADAGLDLVEVSPNAEPPVCKILNYGKYKYEQQKKKTEAKKNQKVIEVKEIQMRPVIDENDFNVKLRAIRRFLEEGNKVKVAIRFRGREITHQDLGMEVINRVKEDVSEIAKVDQTPKLEGRQILMILSPAAPK